MVRSIVVVKPTNDCNLRCKYCYTQENAPKEIMSQDTLKNTLTKFLRYYKKNGVDIHFLWHGGEPLFVGLDFYKFARKIQKEESNGVKIINSIQSNGTLFNECILDWMVQEQFRMGLSIDGPPNLHNLNRIYSNGEGSFDRILKTLKLMRERKVPLRAIMVLTKSHLDKLPEIYKFFKSEGINFKVHAPVDAGRMLGCTDTHVSFEEYGRSLTDLFDIWFNDGDFKIKIEPLYQIIGDLLTKKPRECSFLSSCQERFISVAPDGKVYPCGRFDGINELVYGNINENSIEEILDSRIRQGLLSRSPEKIEDCVICEWKKICNAGCMNNSYNSGDIFNKDPFCSAYKMVFDHISKNVNSELKKEGINIPLSLDEDAECLLI